VSSACLLGPSGGWIGQASCCKLGATCLLCGATRLGGLPGAAAEERGARVFVVALPEGQPVLCAPKLALLVWLQQRAQAQVLRAPLLARTTRQIGLHVSANPVHPANWLVLPQLSRLAVNQRERQQH